ncbi:LysM peptidoglycan-binding domain-containing protein [Cytobacillus oceanisediminis]|jgi:LysM repeat protein|uniref:LysM peptidoglycan-binding domain-containing protein n=2 Tax=Niallia TaxID=2837506 RepID=A0A941GIA6_NIACI|nr:MULTISPECIES: LysM peptidoglycan-binding domain-containing protein [Bacillaceae]EOR21566.1 cell division suppressor protein YneA [Niallia nealsonii AAU1]MBQ6447482.1 LysM peptidoglycan-binding domain-containing protein [Bacillus sp. (in: firmicutes)]MDU1847957.1 LysM peptidoglycan-binding domain-containing protein [Niallia nealsonii]MBZ9535829.1 LysM peptidoglycan-binding domain-containing protein [Cytobacillus oceanisediminis]MCB5238491.1 LysM peptidoglycan-binding domain-containing protei
MAKLWEKYSYTIILLICGLAACIMIVVNTGESDSSDYMSVTVKNGETVWELSNEYAGSYNMTKKQFIKWVEENNNISASNITVGKELLIPVREEDHQLMLASE